VQRPHFLVVRLVQIGRIAGDDNARCRAMDALGHPEDLVDIEDAHDRVGDGISLVGAKASCATPFEVGPGSISCNFPIKARVHGHAIESI
jgi:hypothetical protein